MAPILLTRAASPPKSPVSEAAPGGASAEVETYEDPGDWGLPVGPGLPNCGLRGAGRIGVPGTLRIPRAVLTKEARTPERLRPVRERLRSRCSLACVSASDSPPSPCFCICSCSARPTWTSAKARFRRTHTSSSSAIGSGCLVAWVLFSAHFLPRGGGPVPTCKEPSCPAQSRSCTGGFPPPCVAAVSPGVRRCCLSVSSASKSSALLPATFARRRTSALGRGDGRPLPLPPALGRGEIFGLMPRTLR